MAIKPLIQNISFENNGFLTISKDDQTAEIILSMSGEPFQAALTALNIPSLDVRLSVTDSQKVARGIMASQQIAALV